jgi:hypothetical protein
MNVIPHVLAATAIAASGMAPIAGHAGPVRPSLNDTGQTRCADVADQWTSQCAGTGQDAAFGRDATRPRSADGVAGFSFLRVCNTGEPAGFGGCPRVPARGPGLHDWGCTFDRVTGLTWEVKTDDGGLRDWRHLYTRTRPQDPGYGTPSDAAGFVHAVNHRGGLCGSSHWRLPRLTGPATATGCRTSRRC